MGQLPPLARHMRTGLSLLLDACTLARGLNRNSSEFAVEMADLSRAGATHADIRWLVCKGYAQSLVECTPKNATVRRFRKARNLRITENNCFILTMSGLAVAERLSDAGCDAAPHDSKASKDRQQPNWDGSRRQLWWRGTMIKHFRVPAANQEAVLSAFEEQGWPPRIVDPIPPGIGDESPPAPAGHC